MFVVICYLNAGRCIWTNFCDVISIRRLASQSKTTSTCWWNWLSGFAGNYCLLMNWSVLLINLCLFAIQNCFLTFMKVLVNRTWLMDWLRCANKNAFTSRTMHDMRNLLVYDWLSATFFWLDFLIGHSKKLQSYRNKDHRFGMGKDKKTWLSQHIINGVRPMRDGMLLLFGQDLFELRFVLVCGNF